MSYDPSTFRGLTFHDARDAFRDGTDTPRAYLERCLEAVAARESIAVASSAAATKLMYVNTIKLIFIIFLQSGDTATGLGFAMNI